MTEEVYRRRRRTRKLRSSKRVRLVLMLLGLCSLAIGLALMLLATRFSPGSRLGWLGPVYLAAGAAILLLRLLFVQVDRIRKRKYRKR